MCCSRTGKICKISEELSDPLLCNTRAVPSPLRKKSCKAFWGSRSALVLTGFCAVLVNTLKNWFCTFIRYMDTDSGPNISQEINKMHCCGFGFGTYKLNTICTSRVVTGILHIFSYKETIPDLCNNSYKETMPDLWNDSYKETVPDLWIDSYKETVPDLCNDSYKEIIQTCKLLDRVAWPQVQTPDSPVHGAGKDQRLQRMNQQLGHSVTHLRRNKNCIFIKQQIKKWTVRYRIP